MLHLMYTQITAVAAAVAVAVAYLNYLCPIFEKSLQANFCYGTMNQQHLLSQHEQFSAEKKVERKDKTKRERKNYLLIVHSIHMMRNIGITLELFFFHKFVLPSTIIGDMSHDQSE